MRGQRLEKGLRALDAETHAETHQESVQKILPEDDGREPAGLSEDADEKGQKDEHHAVHYADDDEFPPVKLCELSLKQERKLHHGKVHAE